MSRSSLTRRTLLGLGIAAGSSSLLTACSTSSTGSGAGSGSMDLWIWPDGFGDEIIRSVTDTHKDAGFRQVIQGGEFKQKLQTTLQAGSNLPAITGIKGEDIAYFRSVPELFVDLATLGADDITGEYVDWKWKQAQTADGKQLGIPIDIGPTGLFYRFDIFEKHGIASDPAELGQQLQTWEQYVEIGKKLRAADPQTFLVRNLASIFETIWRQSGRAFIDDTRAFIGDQDHIKQAWDTAVSAQDAGINAALTAQTADSTAAVAAGRLPADIGASWHLGDLISDAPDTSGMWHVTNHPGSPTNRGGSFLAIPAKAEGHDKAFEIITLLLDADNQAKEFTHSGNFPANTGAFGSEQLAGPVDFLGGQVSGEFFAQAAEKVPALYEDPADGTVNAPFYSELELVESSGKDPGTAWTDAVTQAKELAQQNGITVG